MEIHEPGHHMSGQPQSFSVEHYRQLQRHAQDGIAERARLEQELSTLAPAGSVHADQPLEVQIRRLTEKFHYELAAVDQRCSATRAEHEDRYRAEVAALRARHCAQAAEIDERVAAELHESDRAYQENCWLLESIFDDESDQSPQWQFERFESQLALSRDRLTAECSELESLCEWTCALIERRRQRIAIDPEPSTAPRGREQTLEWFTAAAQQARDLSEKLSHQVLPRLFVGWRAPLATLVLWIVAAALPWGLVEPQHLGLARLDRTEWGLVVAGVAFGGCCVILLSLYSIAAHQTAQAFEPFLQSLTNARDWSAQWLKLSAEELQVRQRDFQARQAAIIERRERSLRQFLDAKEVRGTEIERCRQEELSQAENERDEALKEGALRHKQQIHSVDAGHRRDALALRTAYEAECGRLVNQFDEERAASLAKRTAIEDRCRAGWVTTLCELAEETAAAQHASRKLFPNWDEIVRTGWQPPQKIPQGVRLGDYRFDLRELPDGTPRDAWLAVPDSECLWPAVLPFPASLSLLLKAHGAGRAAGVEILQAAMLRLLTLLPAGDVRFTVIDPVGLGENFSAFMHLADFDDLLISHRIWTEGPQIDQQLARLTEHMENVFQKYLRNEFETLEAYNERAGEVAEPYRILVVANFPANFSERAAQRLVSIATSGARCGVYTLVSVDTRQPLPRGFDLSNLEIGATVLEWREGHFWNLAFGPPLRLAADLPPAAPTMAALIRQVGEHSRDVRKVEVPFHRIVPREEQYWTTDSRKQIEVPLGRAGAIKLQHLRLGTGTSQHVLIAGKTGSGKSTLLNVIVTDLALRYSPDEVEFYLVDFKKGVEFKAYAAERLPHARVISIESDREFGVSVLERLDSVLRQRGDLFRREQVQDIAAFRDARPDVRLPRILLIVDEFQEFFVEDDRYSQAAGLLLDRLVRQGRAFGIHVLLGSQTLGGAYSLARTTIGQMAVRVALQCSETDANLILSEDNSAARLLTRPGEAIFNDANGMLEGNSPFQVAWLGDAERDNWLQRIRKLASERGDQWTDAFVFEGNVPADPTRNALLQDLLVPESAKSSSQAETVIAGVPPVPCIWLGEAVSLTGPTSLSFERHSGSNLLLVGQDADAARGIFSVGLVALLAQSPQISREEGDTELLVDVVTEEPAATAQGYWSNFADVSPEQIRLVASKNIPGLLGELLTEVHNRQAASEPGTTRFVFIEDLSRFRELRKSEDEFGFGSMGRDKPASPGQQFAELLRDGPAVGIHFVVWCDSYNNLERCVSRASLKEFERRVVFPMSAADSSNLIDTPAASRLGTNRALLYTDALGTTEKFRPYAPPSAQWLSKAKDALRAPEAPAPVEVADAACLNLWTVS